MLWETRKYSYFIIQTPADFSAVLRHVVSVTLVVFLNITPHLRNLGRATHSTNKNQGKNEKKILIGQRVLGSGKREF
jgi:hypothetical protein